MAVLVLSQHLAKFFFFLSFFSSYTSSCTPFVPSTLSHPFIAPSKTKMADNSDLFDGAIGIDLGTTYSYVSLIVTALHTSRRVQLRGRMAKRPC